MIAIRPRKMRISHSYEVYETISSTYFGILQINIRGDAKYYEIVESLINNIKNGEEVGFIPVKKIKNDKLLVENGSKVCTIMPTGSSTFKNTITTENAIKNENVPLCSICIDEPIDVVMWPCRHLVCFSCHLKIKYCPLCREEIECSFKVFLN